METNKTDNRQEYQRVYFRDYYLRNKDKILRKNKLWFLNNRDKSYAIAEKWRKRYPHKAKLINEKGRLKYKNYNPNPHKAKKRYTVEEEELLRTTKKGPKELSLILGRTPLAILSKKRRL